MAEPLELHIWIEGKPDENDFEFLTDIGNHVRRQYSGAYRTSDQRGGFTIKFEVVEA